MSQPLRVRVREWSAWAPGFETRDEWNEFFLGKRGFGGDSTPELAGIAPMLRRRMSRLTRMALSTALECCSRAEIPLDDARVVLASRHGEIGVSVELLEQLAAGEPVSPTQFSGSVHHIALGYLSIVASSRQPMRAIGAGEASFMYGFLDAAGWSEDEEGAPVILITVDDRVPEPFSGMVGKNNFPYATALLLEKAEGGVGTPVSLSWNVSSRTDMFPDGIPALGFLKWFLSGEKTLEQISGRKKWRWEK
jgi:hypothetical protein